MEPYVLDVHEHGAFIQDDFKLRRNVTVNAGLRYEIFTPGVERQDRLANYDPVGKRFIYAGEDGATRAANKKTQFGNWAPRLGLAWDISGNATTVLRTGYGITYFPIPHSAGSMIGLQPPWAISQNFSTETNPLNYSNLPLISQPFQPIQVVQPRTTAELNAANPRVLGHSFENETPYTQQWHLGIERALFTNYMVEVGYIGSAGKHLILRYNPNEVQPGLGSQASRRLIPELSNISNMVQFDPRNRSTYHAGILKVQRRFSQRPAVPLELHVVEVARLRRLGGERRRPDGRSADGHQPGRRARDRPASTCGTASSSAASTSCRSARASRCWTKASWA